MTPEGMFKTSLAKSEYVTRKELIDRKLAAAGWHVIEFDASKPLAKFDRCAIEEMDLLITRCVWADRFWVSSRARNSP
jgi:hypothetical protein